MFKFLKEKLKGAIDRFKKVSGDLEAESQEAKGKIKEEEKEIKKIKKEEQELEKEEQKLEKREKKLEKEEQKLAAEKKEKVEEKIEAIEEEKEKVQDTIAELKGEEKEKKSVLGKIKEKLLTTRLTEEGFAQLFQPIELALIESNVAMKVIDLLKKRLQKEIINKPFGKREIEVKISQALREILNEILLEPFDLIEKIKKKKEKPYVIVFFGINGSGKTTTIAKFAHLLQKNKLSCVLAASDTFRAASIEQLEKHASKLNVKLIKHDYGADPAAVAFDAIAHAKAKAIDTVLIDTAGRMHTKADLLKEMEKICRVAKPDLKLFVGEAIVGNDVIEQASRFNAAIGIDASILTKADVDEKGGAMISIGEITKKPILYLGTGQNYKDLERFSPSKIIASII